MPEKKWSCFSPAPSRIEYAEQEVDRGKLLKMQQNQKLKCYAQEQKQQCVLKLLRWLARSSSCIIHPKNFRLFVNHKVVALRIEEICHWTKPPWSYAALASIGLCRHRRRSQAFIEIIIVVRNVQSRVQVAFGEVASVRINLLLGGREEVLIILVSDEAWVVARRKGNTLAASSSRGHTLVVVGVTIRSATPRSDLEGAHSPKFDQSMEVAKENRGWIIHDIHGISPE